MDAIEYVGLAATLMVFIGFTRKGELPIRAFNTVGSILFVIYGLSIGALSVWVLNAACTILNIYHIINLKNFKKLEEKS